MDKQLMSGTSAIGEAAIQAGCRYYFGYPITPQNELPEYMSRRLAEVPGGVLSRLKVSSHPSIWFWGQVSRGPGL